MPDFSTRREFLPQRAGIPIQNTNHQPPPGFFERFHPPNDSRYVMEGMYSGQNSSPLLNGHNSQVLNGRRVLREPLPGPLKWQEPVVCTNIDASKFHPSVPIPSSHSPTPLLTQNSGRSYGPVHDHHVTTVLNGNVGSNLPCPVPRQAALNLYPSRLPERVQVRDASAVNLGVSEKSLARATSTLKNKLLNESISRFHMEQEERIGEIADAHGVSFDRVKKLAGTSKHHRKKRVNSTQDAILHAKTKELNEGRRHKAKISEIQRAAKLDDNLQDAKTDPEKLKILMEELEEHQQAKKDVARASNKVGAMRVTRLLQSFNTDFQELREATNVAGFGFFVRGTFESSIKPTVIGGGPVHEFFQQYFKKDPWEMACLFEAFVTTYNKAQITGVDNIRMNYPNLRTKISAKYKVKIVGWPADVEVMSPREITDPAKLDAVYDAWRSSSAYWSIMDKQEYKKFMAQLERDKTAGLQVEVPRKVRSDRGGTHQKTAMKRQRTSNADGPAAKRQRTSQLMKQTRVTEQESDYAGDDANGAGDEVEDEVEGEGEDEVEGEGEDEDEVEGEGEGEDEDEVEGEGEGEDEDEVEGEGEGEDEDEVEGEGEDEGEDEEN
ncbi:MAG: hypothetical protein NXY57DRAFT_1044144 [Lentinula lateritia]|nr:MAG: hypothetical protein NXY57DRAFT_1044144 [Lentinula lateritia]